MHSQLRMHALHKGFHRERARVQVALPEVTAHLRELLGLERTAVAALRQRGVV